MDKIEAMTLLSEIKNYLTAGNPVWDVDEIAEACDMAIEALRNEINCVKCVHYIERETPTGIKGVCKMDTAHREDIIRRSDALKPFCIAPDGTRIPEVDCDNLPVEFSVEFIKKHLLSLPSADAVSKGVFDQIKWERDVALQTLEEHDIGFGEAEDRLYIKIYADDEPSVMAEKLYQICGETQNGEVAEWLKEYFPSAESRTGKWVKDALGMTVCSECRRWRRDNRTSHVNFCNSCGARMIGEEK